jgi:hypothetical protein
MHALYRLVNGCLYRLGQRSLLLLDESLPPLTLRCAFAELYGEAHILPALLLDDWGKEVKTLALYEWAREFGAHFPRAELFGFYPDGRETQTFLRDLDLHHPYPGYVYERPEAPLATGRLLDAILIPGENQAPQRIRRPAGLGPLLRYAAVSWWQVQPSSPLLQNSGYTFLDD